MQSIPVAQDAAIGVCHEISCHRMISQVLELQSDAALRNDHWHQAWAVSLSSRSWIDPAYDLITGGVSAWGMAKATPTGVVQHEMATLRSIPIQAEIASTVNPASLVLSFPTSGKGLGAGRAGAAVVPFDDG